MSEPWSDSKLTISAASDAVTADAVSWGDMAADGGDEYDELRFHMSDIDTLPNKQLNITIAHSCNASPGSAHAFADAVKTRSHNTVIGLADYENATAMTISFAEVNSLQQHTTTQSALSFMLAAPSTTPRAALTPGDNGNDAAATATGVVVSRDAAYLSWVSHDMTAKTMTDLRHMISALRARRCETALEFKNMLGELVTMFGLLDYRLKLSPKLVDQPFTSPPSVQSHPDHLLFAVATAAMAACDATADGGTDDKFKTSSPGCCGVDMVRDMDIALQNVKEYVLDLGRIRTTPPLDILRTFSHSATSLSVCTTSAADKTGVEADYKEGADESGLVSKAVPTVNAMMTACTILRQVGIFTTIVPDSVVLPALRCNTVSCGGDDNVVEPAAKKSNHASLVSVLSGKLKGHSTNNDRYDHDRSETMTIYGSEMIQGDGIHIVRSSDNCTNSHCGLHIRAMYEKDVVNDLDFVSAIFKHANNHHVRIREQLLFLFGHVIAETDPARLIEANMISSRLETTYHRPLSMYAVDFRFLLSSHSDVRRAVKLVDGIITATTKYNTTFNIFHGRHSYYTEHAIVDGRPATFLVIHSHVPPSHVGTQAIDWSVVMRGHSTLRFHDAWEVSSSAEMHTTDTSSGLDYPAAECGRYMMDSNVLSSQPKLDPRTPECGYIQRGQSRFTATYRYCQGDVKSTKPAKTQQLPHHKHTVLYTRRISRLKSA